uniref:Guanylate cyclase domain-containing protein n=1 Tax=Euplotes crassus TaxID=5936 RepID=A0A7S3NWZ5_EUPCR|mmetsp:Transcript_25979/g.25809  ORF Transcript_25979/g.25809 Transcript_25979/m.25809 type:complete len:670 (+) Transcript_25979:1212-3221(+)
MLTSIQFCLNKASDLRTARRNKASNVSLHTITSSKKSVRVSRYSNVNIALLNSMKSNETQQGEELQEALSEQTKLEKKASLLTIKRTLTCFFAVVFGIPLFISTTYKPWLSEFVPMAKMVERTRSLGDQQAYLSEMNFIVDNHKDDFDRIVGLKGPGYEWKAEDWVNDKIRTLELIQISEGQYTFTADLSRSIKLYSVCGICGYVIGGAFLIGFVIYINRDLNKYVIYPLESMYEKVTILGRDPMIATQEDFGRKAGIVSLLQSNSKSNNEEIHLIDKSITKIAYLMAVGYGEAGTGIIIKNMGKAKGLDVDIRGEKVIGIYGFCDIRNFTDATEVLQTDVMKFVNQIAAVVHVNIVKFGGSNNKNIGDAFLYVWKLASFSEAKPFAYRLQDFMRKRHDLNEDEKGIIKMICDCSVYCVVKIIAKINSYKHILAYRENEKLNERIPEYSIQMGFGLHIGWAIEGLIGSQFKIDASYLSPHVNLASRLEAATKQYGVKFLLSEPLYDMLSKDFQAKCRCVDRCTLKGVAEPLRLYTFEVDVSNLPKHKDKYLKMDSKERQSEVNREKSILYNKILNEEITTSDLLKRDKEIRRVLHFHNMNSRGPFINNYRKGFKNYLKGDWQEAHKHFEKCLIINPSDGPSKVLERYIKENDYDSASVGWQGYRVLTSK